MPGTTEVTTIPNIRKVIYDTYGAFPTTGITAGDLAYATDTNLLYRWSGAAWQPITQVGGGKVIFGDGSDGDVTIVANTTLSRDMYYGNLTVNATKNLITAGFRIFVKNTLTNNGVIQCDGNSPTLLYNGGVAGGPSGSLGVGYNGGAGKSFVGMVNIGGGGGGGAGVVFICARILINSSGTIRANGGSGGDASNQNVGAGGPVAGTNATATLSGAGGSGGNFAGGLVGNGGTATAMSVTMGGTFAAPVIFQAKGTGNPVWNGGAGGGGGDSNGTGDAGGGGGGAGGLVILIYDSLTAGTESVIHGVGGHGVSAGGDGANGGEGYILKLANV